MSHILTKDEDIRQWAEAHIAVPIMMETPDGSGTRSILQLSFGQHVLNAENNEGPDRIGGFQIVSWDEWLTALKAQNLAIRVADQMAGGKETEFQFVPRDAT
jgi:hypothetical protein